MFMLMELFSTSNKKDIRNLATYVFKTFDERNKTLPVMILSFRTDRSGQTKQSQIRLLSVYTVCHSVCIVWTHYSMVEPLSSNFRVVTTSFLPFRIFRKFTVRVCCITEYRRFPKYSDTRKNVVINNQMFLVLTV